MHNKNQFGDMHQLPSGVRAGDWTLPWINTSTSALENDRCLCRITLKHLHSASVQALSSEPHREMFQGCRATQLPAQAPSAPWCPKAALYPAGTNLEPVQVNAHPEPTIRAGSPWRRAECWLPGSSCIPNPPPQRRAASTAGTPSSRRHIASSIPPKCSPL